MIEIESNLTKTEQEDTKKQHIIVIDVAAEYGGAETVLDSFIKQAENDDTKYYTFVIGLLKRKEQNHIRIIRIPWIKRSKLHRLLFDLVYAPYMIKRMKANEVISLQNNAFPISKTKQIVYFHNALPLSEKKYTFTESYTIWLYQRVIGEYWKKSLKNADEIVVQSEWIRRELHEKWEIDINRIRVEKPIIAREYNENVNINQDTNVLFYPSNKEKYKNHEVLLKALDELWSEGETIILHLTGSETGLNEECMRIVEKHHEKITFLGTLTTIQMVEEYSNSILIFPSLIETVGMPLLEAKALGQKILAADVMYARATLGNYSNVIYFDPQSVESVKIAISARERIGNEITDC